MKLSEFQRIMEQRNRSAGYRLPTGVYGFGPVSEPKKRAAEKRSKPRKSTAGSTTPATPKRRSTGQSGASNGRSKSGARPRIRLVRTTVQHPIARRIMAELDDKPVRTQFDDTPISGLVYRVEFTQRG